MIRTLLLCLCLCLCLSACSSSSAQPALPSGEQIPLQLDLALCHERTDGAPVPVYDGEMWRLTTAAPMRCGVQLQAGDMITEWIVYGRHDLAGTQEVEACLQELEVYAGTRHTDVGECDISPGTERGPDDQFSLTKKLDPAKFVTDDGAYSLRIIATGSGSRAAAATVIVLRP